MSPLLYQIHCIGPVGFGFAHIYSERHPLQIGTQQLAPSVGRTGVLGKTIIEQGRAKPPRGNDDGQPTRSQMGNCQEVPSSTGIWHHVRGLRPHQGSDNPPTSRAAPIGPDRGRRRPCETLLRGYAAGAVFGDWCWCLLTHSSS